MRDTYTIIWRELLLLRKKLLRFFASSLVSPLLFLTAFGWGLGRSIQFGGTSYLEFVVPGILAMSAMNSSYNATGMSLNISRLYFKTLEEFLVAPISTWSLTLGNVLGGCLRGLLSSVVILVLAHLYGACLHCDLWFFVALFLTCFLFSALGLVAAMVINSHEDMARFSTFVILPMSFLCGTFFQVDRFPPVVAKIVQVLPLTHSAISLRMIALEAGFPLVSLLVLAAYAVFFFWLGYWVTLRVE
ncbi:MAG: ABC-2 type transporter [Thermoanaerobacterales bacterium 50_218]|nr:MAG: ABC-2 type transporter [Thermoanaerobacterales bacterium 50_218]HAA89588.1 multidrug ABC transporter permease [Peptococcaceae bacterium]